jgi:5-methylcytosine-specific restriction endonuclease McrA
MLAEQMKLHQRKPHTLTDALLRAQKERGLKRLGIKINSKEISCIQCGKVFYTPECRVNGKMDKNGHPQLRKFCSRKCQGLSIRKEDSLKAEKVRLEDWSMAVKERDSYICRDCGCLRKRLLQAHHIIAKEDNADLWYEITNGITLCVYCHAKQHGEQLTNFILSSIHVRGLRRPYGQRISCVC